MPYGGCRCGSPLTGIHAFHQKNERIMKRRYSVKIDLAQIQQRIIYLKWIICIYFSYRALFRLNVHESKSVSLERHLAFNINRLIKFHLVAIYLYFCTILNFVMYGKHSPIKSFLNHKTKVCLFISNTGSEFSIDFSHCKNCNSVFLRICLAVRLSSGHHVPQSIRIWVWLPKRWCKNLTRRWTLSSTPRICTFT